jgi:hypothetical protein
MVRSSIRFQGTLGGGKGKWRWVRECPQRVAALYLRCAELVEPTDYPESMALHGRAVAIAPVSDGAGILARKK